MHNKKPNKKNDNPSNQEIPDLWKVLQKRKKQGKWDGEIEIIPIKEFNLSKGAHYFVIDNPGKHSIKCISCPISHGGILEAHLLHQYKLEDGVLYLKGKAINERAQLKNNE